MISIVVTTRDRAGTVRRIVQGARARIGAVDTAAAPGTSGGPLRDSLLTVQALLSEKLPRSIRVTKVDGESW
jgi:hypothetical protein